MSPPIAVTRLSTGEAVLSATPLSVRERSALRRILSASANDALALQARQRAALDAYIEVLSTPPLAPDEVVGSARALIKVWAQVPVPVQPRPILQSSVLDQSAKRARPKVFRATVSAENTPLPRPQTRRPKPECKSPVLPPPVKKDRTLRPRRSRPDRQHFFATLLELEPTAMTEPLSPMAIRELFWLS